MSTEAKARAASRELHAGFVDLQKAICAIATVGADEEDPSVRRQMTDMVQDLEALAVKLERLELTLHVRAVSRELEASGG